MKKKNNKKKGIKSTSRKSPRVAVTEQVRPPILCRPGAEMSTPLYYIGWALRSLVLFCGIFGLSLFIGDGFGFHTKGGTGSIPVLALVSLALTVICSFAAWNKRTLLFVPILGAGAGIGILFAFSSNPFLLIWDGIRYVINNSLLHMVDLGYTSFGEYLIGSTSYYGGDSLAANVGFAVLASVFALILGLSLLRKVHTVPAVLASVIVIVPIFMYNLTHDNAGVSLVLIFIFGEISLLFYEKKFSNYEARRIEKKKAKEEKKAKKAALIKEKKEKKAALDSAAVRAYAIALEITGDKVSARRAKNAVYTLEDERIKAEKKAAELAKKEEKKNAKTEKKAAKNQAKIDRKAKKAALAKEKKEFANLSPEERARRTAQKNAEKKAVSDAIREKKHQHHIAQTNVRKTLSASGYAGGTAILAAALAVWLPFSAISGNFMTIDFINDPVSVAREYVTAYLRGDDIDLNNMRDVAELTPRTLTYDSPEYKEIQMLAVETERAEPVYLRGWIGMKFDAATGTWTSGTNEDVALYRRQFNDKYDTAFNPDILKTELLGRLFPTSVEFDKNNIALRFSNYGFDVRQIHLRRINGESLIVYVPPTLNTERGILAYNSLEPNQAKYSAYFDSIYSSRFFNDTVNYSTVSFMTKLSDPDVTKELTDLPKHIDLYKRYIDIYFDAYEVLERESNTGLRKYDTGRGIVNIALEDFSDLDRLFKEECKKLGYSELMGDSLVERFLNLTPEEKKTEKKELENFITTEEEYLEWAYLHYSSSTYSDAVIDLSRELLKDAGYVRNTKSKSMTPLYTDRNGNSIDQHSVVMTVINHLRENYTYTLTPEPYSGDKEMTVLDSFLTETKNGYCTHFATAAAALLREYGYSVRYSEGYLVSDFARNYTEGAPAKYKGFAMDSNAHAWIEVYYPTMGWVAYETVPDYMEYMYDPTSADSGENGEIADFVPDEEIEIPPVEEPPVEEPLPEEPPVEELPIEEEAEEEGIDQMKVLIICAIVIAGLALIFLILRLIIRRIVKKAENAVEDRHRHIVLAMDTERLQKQNIDTMPIAREFDDTILRVFKIIGYPPRTGEQYSEYASRLEMDFGGMTDYSLSQIFGLVAKVEFGNVISNEELYILADFTDRFVTSAYAGLTHIEKIKYRYIKRVI